MLAATGNLHRMAPLTGPPSAARIGDGAFQLNTDAVGCTFCADMFTHNQVWLADQIPGVRTWESHRGELWLQVPFNAVGSVQRVLGVELPRWNGDLAWGLPPTRPLFEKLRDYQREAYHLFASPGCSGQLLLGDAMGLGKSLTAIACVEQRPGPKLIIGPKALRATWRAELAKWTPGEPFHAIETMNPSANHVAQLPKLEDMKWVYIHYDIVFAWWSWLRMYRFAAVIMDEVHTVKNVTTKRGQGVMMAVGSIPARVLLSGTPIENRTAELHHLLQLVTGKGTWGGKGAFRIRYVGAKANPHGGLLDGKPTNVEELDERMRSHYLRRVPSQVAMGLPPLQRIPVVVAMDEKAQAKLEKVLADPAAVHAMLLFSQTGKLPSAQDHQAIKAIGKLRKAVSALKHEATTRTVMGHIMSGAGERLDGRSNSQTVVFTWTRESAAAIAKRIETATIKAGGSDLALVFTVTGADTQKVRDRTIDEYRKCSVMGHPTVMVATYGALGVGVNLQCANAVVMHDMDWIPGVMLQAEARAWRGGQDRPVTSYWMIGEGTFDEYIIRTLLSKADEIAAAIGDDEPQKLRDAFRAYAEQDDFEDYATRLTAWQENRI